LSVNKTSSWGSYESKRIIILGSGFAGIEVLKSLQKAFRKDKTIEIILVSKDNFLLFTPMLPEVSTGMIETRHVITPVRSFCSKASFYEAEVESINLESRKVFLKHSIGRQSQPVAWAGHTLDYDILVIALGSENNFFGMTDIEAHSFTMKDIDDAISLRNHVINVLEQANLEHENRELCHKLLTFVVVGGGFNGIETVGGLNDYVRSTVKEFYKDIYPTDIRIVLVNASNRILEQVDEELGEYTLSRLKAKGIDVMLNTEVSGATANSILLKEGTSIPSFTIIWSAGVAPSKLISTLNCKHDNGHRIMANNYLEIPGHEGVVYVLGDCASIIDPNTGKPYPPTAQHAIKEGRVAANNIITEIKGKGHKKQLDYKTKGMMAEIGKRDGVATLFEFKLHGFIAWWMWRTFYLGNLPTKGKKLKVLFDWTMDLLFKPDVAMIKRIAEPKKISENTDFNKCNFKAVEKRLEPQNQ
jgi:NADH dehydrogenase